MKIVVLGDIHGRTIWKDILKKEQPDKVIFLGDYVSTHGNETAQQQLDNLQEILNTKTLLPDQIILLRGNHDIQHLGYHWAECSGRNHQVECAMSSLPLYKEFLDRTQWLHIESFSNKKVIFSHAGVSMVWWGNVQKRHNIHDFNEINNLEPSETFGFTPGDGPDLWDMYGTSPTQPLTWIRPETLAKHMPEGYTQVVGHTTVNQIGHLLVDHEDSRQVDDLWLCDSLEFNNYLVINDGHFEPKYLIS